MCILFCYIADEKNETGYELILLSNRDEDFQRPAIPAHVWKDTIYALGGQDQTASREGGTWLCLNTVQSKIAVLLNLPSRLCGGKNPNALSRGFLVPDFVNDPKITLNSYLEKLQKTKINYTGFNFLGLERQSESKKWHAKYINNMSSESFPVNIDIPIFGFSNHLYGDEYAFEKTQHGCRLLEKILVDLTDNYTKTVSDEKELIQQMLSLLNDVTAFPEDNNIADVYSHYTIENRHQISSVHVPTTVQWPTYGTRTSTVILVRGDQTGVFIEKTLCNPLENINEWAMNTWHFKLNDIDVIPFLINE